MRTKPWINHATNASPLTAFAALLLGFAENTFAQSPSVQERVALKSSLAANQAILRQYEWIETTAVSLKGEQKSRKPNRSYYGVPGRA